MMRPMTKESGETRAADLNDPVSLHMHTQYAAVQDAWSIGQALEEIRRSAPPASILYFYVLDGEGRLVGVVSSRQLLTEPLDRRVSEIMGRRVVAIPDSFNVLEACEMFVMHRLLAFPVISAERKMLGVVDIRLYADGMFDVGEREQVDQLFEQMGFRVQALRQAAPLKAFRMRFTWLLSTLVGGTLCALLSGAFHATLAQALILTFFLTVVLGLGESVCVQAMSLAIDALRHEQPTAAWFRRRIGREALVSAMLGIACAAAIGGIAWIWKGQAAAAGAIAGGIAAAVVAAGAIGIAVPSLLHRLGLDLKVASGPLALALTDLCTLTCYFGAAALVLG